MPNSQASPQNKKRPDDDDHEKWALIFQLATQFTYIDDTANALGVRPATVKAWVRHRPALLRKHFAKMQKLADRHERDLMQNLPNMYYGAIRHAVQVIESLRGRWFYATGEHQAAIDRVRAVAAGTRRPR